MLTFHKVTVTSMASDVCEPASCHHLQKIMGKKGHVARLSRNDEKYLDESIFFHSRE